MAGIARLALQLGHNVSGSDKGTIYPPMNSQLEKLAIPVSSGYSESSIPDNIDTVIIGNSLSRGNPLVEKILDEKIYYLSGPAWLEENVLRDKKKIVIAGTHGKTTISSLVAWILEKNNLRPGFLIGGIPSNFEFSAHIGGGDLFVIEGDEYDSAFFDKRSKFIHYHPDILVINNLEYDHADIFSNLSEIVTQFHHLIRSMASSATIVRPEKSRTIDNLLKKGCWSSVKTFGHGVDADLQYSYRKSQNNKVKMLAKTGWLKNIGIGMGKHNAANLAAAVAAAECVGVSMEESLNASREFLNVKRRMELKGIANKVSVYDDFAHHPTAIRASVVALKNTLKDNQKLLAIVEPRSNTIKMGRHKKHLSSSLKEADRIGVYTEIELSWDIEAIFPKKKFIGVFSDPNEMARLLAHETKPGDKILVMSNGAAGNLHQLLLTELTPEGHQ